MTDEDITKRENRQTHLLIGRWPEGGVSHLDIPEVVDGAVGRQGLLRQEGHRLVHIAIAQLECPLDSPHIREAHVEQKGDILVLLLHLPVNMCTSLPRAEEPHSATGALALYSHHILD